MRHLIWVLIVIVIVVTLIGLQNIQQTHLKTIQAEISFSNKPSLYQPTNVKFDILSHTNLENVSAEIILPESFELIDGQLSWDGNLEENKPIQINATIRAVKEGNWTINGIIKNSTTDLVMESKLVTVTEPEEHEAIHGEPSPEVPSWILMKSNNYLISTLGKNYFEKNLDLTRSVTLSSPYKYDALYIVEYNYSLGNNIFWVVVRLSSNGTVVTYRGPDKPYSFNINQSEAIQIAKAKGLTEPITAELVYGGIGFTADSGSIYESYMWNLWTSNYSAGNLENVYIDIQNGSILGVYTYPNITGSVLAN